jgi:hypothetical protein
MLPDSELHVTKTEGHPGDLGEEHPRLREYDGGL